MLSFDDSIVFHCPGAESWDGTNIWVNSRASDTVSRIWP
jgi:hypothetical protein